MDATRAVKTISNWTAQEKTRKESIRKRWKDGVKEDLKSMGKKRAQKREAINKAEWKQNV